MNLSQFNFQYAPWLWALAFIPLMFLLRKFAKPKLDFGINHLERFADKHLLPYLLKKPGSEKKGAKKNLFILSTLWFLGVLALAGPRWDFKEVQTYKPHKDLVILLDLSDSMDVTDVKPSRLVRARQKIADLLNENPDVNAGLIGFAEDAHVITPITEDRDAVLHLLNAVRTDLIAVQGNQLSPAISMAEELLRSSTGSDKAILIMSDGNFEDNKIEDAVDRVASHGIKVSAMGFGSAEAVSPLDQSALEKISAQGHGKYFSLNDTIKSQNLFSSSIATNQVETSSGVTKDWEPRFYIFLLPMLLLMIPMFRRKTFFEKQSAKVAMVLWMLFVLGYSDIAKADEKNTPQRINTSKLSDFFKNSDTLGKEALDIQDYQTAIKKFDDPYRRGVAEYKAGDYEKAQKSFEESKRPEVSIASRYNLGNAFAQQGKYQDAIAAYKEVLKQQPDHKPAKENLKIVEDLLKKQPPDQKQPQNNQKTDDDKKNQDEKNAQDNQNSKDNQDSQQNKDSAENKKSKDDQKSENDKQAQGKKDSQDGEQAKENQKSQDQQQAQGEKQSQEGEKPEDNKNSFANQQNQDGKQPQDQNEKPNQNTNSMDMGNDFQKQVRKRTAQDVDADQWLNRISNDPHDFLKNQFMIESTRLRTKKRGQQ